MASRHGDSQAEWIGLHERLDTPRLREELERLDLGNLCTNAMPLCAP